MDLEILEAMQNGHGDVKTHCHASSHDRGMGRTTDMLPAVPSSLPLYTTEFHSTTKYGSFNSGGKHLRASNDIVSLSRSSLPTLSEPLLHRILRFTSIKLGPTSVQIYENAARSIVDLVRSKFDLKHISNVALQIDASRNGVIALAVARMLLNLGVSTVVGISKRSPLADEKHFSFQADLAIKNGFRWINAIPSFSPDLILTGVSSVDLPCPEMLKNVPSSNIVSIGGAPLKSYPGSIHVDLILPTGASMDSPDHQLYVVDVGVSSRIVKMYLQKAAPSVRMEFIDGLFTESSFVHLDN